jgi:hypothetical protein
MRSHVRSPLYEPPKRSTNGCVVLGFLSAQAPTAHRRCRPRLPRCVQVVSLGRELLGGNGILHDFGVAKAFADLEAYYSYEGERYPLLCWRLCPTFRHLWPAEVCCCCAPSAPCPAGSQPQQRLARGLTTPGAEHAAPAALQAPMRSTCWWRAAARPASPLSRRRRPGVARESRMCRPEPGPRKGRRVPEQC